MSEITFYVALEKLLEGERITRVAWEDKRTYILVDDNILSIHKAGETKGKIRPWIVSDVDISADDWFVL